MNETRRELIGKMLTALKTQHDTDSEYVARIAGQQAERYAICAIALALDELLTMMRNERQNS